MTLSQEQEAAPKRSYTSTPRPIAAITKSRTVAADWAKMPDYERLPDWTLLSISEVELLSGMSRSVIDRRVKEGVFAAPKYHGKDRVWSLGYVRQWCRQFGQHVEEGGAA